MRYRFVFLVLVIFSIGWALVHHPRQIVRFPSFDEGQIQSHYTPLDLVNFYQRLPKKRWRLINRLYKTHLEGRRRGRKREKIPKILHQIWLEGPLPESLIKLQTTWKEKHPKWEYYLWTEDEVQILYLQNRPLYEEAQTPKEKSEILRLEILSQFGGVFIDTHLECLKPLDILNEHSDFYAGVTDQIRTPQISNNLIGAIPNHPLIRKCIQELKQHPPSFGSALLTRLFFETIKKNNPEVDVILPSTFFYPKFVHCIQEHTYALPH